MRDERRLPGVVGAGFAATTLRACEEFDGMPARRSFLTDRLQPIDDCRFRAGDRADRRGWG